MHIKVRVKTGAKNESLRQVAPDHLEIAVREQPELNMANKRVIALVAAHFGLAANKVRIVKGQRKPSKLMSVDKP